MDVRRATGEVELEPPRRRGAPHDESSDGALLRPGGSGVSASAGERLKQRIVQDIERAAGRHDEARFYAGPPGDLGLCGGPGSMSWEIHGDFASVVVAGNAAVLMEVMHPSVMHGVHTQSAYRTQTARRARNTLGYVLRTTFGSQQAATDVIAGVKKMHARVSGTRADGVRYRALDPELIAWVHTCIPWAIMLAFERTKRPLSRDEKDRYLREQALIGRMGGADWVPESVDELSAYVERMRPELALTKETSEFLAFLEGRLQDERLERAERFDRWLSVHSSMTLMPEWARRITGTDHPRLATRTVFEPATHLRAKLVRWAYPAPPCVAMAHARVRAQGVADAGAAAGDAPAGE
jgi:uncharacterized protein (DUF2236 family)